LLIKQINLEVFLWMVDRFMDKLQLSESCKNLKHSDCKECMCNCHIPGTMENLARKISLLDKSNPGIGETI
jgi:hypothetical protein